jgi:DNA-binding NarL/FixJ family response regulator
MATTLLIVDDHPAFRSLARAMLSADGFEVTGEAPDGESALAAVQDLQPDAVLLDIQLPGIDGFEVARQIASIDGAPRVVLTSLRAASDYGRRNADSPASGILAKQDLSGPALAARLAFRGTCG